MWLTIAMQEDEEILLIFCLEKQPKPAEKTHYRQNKGKDAYCMHNKPEKLHNYLIKINSNICKWKYSDRKSTRLNSSHRP